MTHKVEATNENGVLKQDDPLPLAEHQKVEVATHTEPSKAEQTAGLLRWTGDPKDLRLIAEDDEFGIQEDR